MISARFIGLFFIENALLSKRFRIEAAILVRKSMIEISSVISCLTPKLHTL